MSEEGSQGDLVCEWCGRSFRPPKVLGRRPQYCRRSCRQRVYEARQTDRAVKKALAYRDVQPAGEPPVELTLF